MAFLLQNFGDRSVPLIKQLIRYETLAQQWNFRRCHLYITMLLEHVARLYLYFTEVDNFFHWFVCCVLYRQLAILVLLPFAISIFLKMCHTTLPTPPYILSGLSLNLQLYDRVRKFESLSEKKEKMLISVKLY